MGATGVQQGQKCFSAHRVLNHPTARCPERLMTFPFPTSDSGPLTIKTYGSQHVQWQRKDKPHHMPQVLHLHQTLLRLLLMQENHLIPYHIDY